MRVRSAAAIMTVAGVVLLGPAASAADVPGTGPNDGSAVIEMIADVPGGPTSGPNPTHSPPRPLEPSPSSDPADSGTSVLAATGASPWIVGVAGALAAIVVGVAARASRVVSPGRRPGRTR